MPMCVNGISLGSSSRTARPRTRGTCEAGMSKWRVRLGGAAWGGFGRLACPAPPLCAGPGPPLYLARHRLYACSGVPHLPTSIPLVSRPGCREVSSGYHVLRALKTSPFWPLRFPHLPYHIYISIMDSCIGSGLPVLPCLALCPATKVDAHHT